MMMRKIIFYFEDNCEVELAKIYLKDLLENEIYLDYPLLEHEKKAIKFLLNTPILCLGGDDLKPGGVLEMTKEEAFVLLKALQQGAKDCTDIEIMPFWGQFIDRLKKQLWLI